MTLPRGALLIIWGICNSNIALASKYAVAKSELNFQARGKPGFIRINGTSGKVEGVLEVQNQELSGSFKSDLKLLDTGIDLRDKHMKETYLELGKYPDTNLVLNPIPWKSDQNEYEGEFSGLLTLHGLQKIVSGDIEITKNKKAIDLEASFSIDLDDFGVKIPTYAGIKVADKVKVSTKIKLGAEK